MIHGSISAGFSTEHDSTEKMPQICFSLSKIFIDRFELSGSSCGATAHIKPHHQQTVGPEPEHEAGQ